MGLEGRFAVMVNVPFRLSRVRDRTVLNTEGAKSIPQCGKSGKIFSPGKIAANARRASS
jgi:hypothetical protein